MNTQNEIRKIPPLNLVLLAIFCILPFIGGIIGLILVFRWIFFVKNKWFLILGLSGIIITGTLLFYLEYSRTHRGIFDRSKIEFAQSNMEKIIKEIEFYKITNGVY